MDDPIKEWVDTFPIYDPVKGPETLILLKNYYNKYNQEIKKSIRKNGVDHYSCNNIYIILQDALKKVTLSGN